MRLTYLLLLAVSLFTFTILWLLPLPSSSAPTETPQKNSITSFLDHFNKKITKPNPVKITLAGDVLLARSVAAKTLKQKDINYPFLKVSPFLSSADIAFFNLESPIFSIHDEVSVNSTSFHTEPEFISTLKNSGVDIVSLANNHTPNQGQAGLQSTIDYLNSVNIKSVGAGNLSDAYKLQTFYVNGQVIGFLAYSDPTLVPPIYAAAANHLGTAMINSDQIKKELTLAKTQVDWLLVSLHFGNEYSSQPSKKQIEISHLAIDSGADFVIGHHPHVLQPIEQYKNGIIFYSVGNFVFDQMFSLSTRESVLVTLSLNKDHTKKISLLPLMIDNFSQPHPANSQESINIIKVLSPPPAFTTQSLIP